MKIDSEELRDLQKVAEVKILAAIVQLEKKSGVSVKKILIYDKRNQPGVRAIDFDIQY